MNVEKINRLTEAAAKSGLTFIELAEVSKKLAIAFEQLTKAIRAEIARRKERKHLKIKSWTLGLTYQENKRLSK